MPDKLSRISHRDNLQAHQEQRACSTENEVKIWLTPPNCNNPLGFDENELRLIRAREKHPSHNIRLVYEPNNLTSQASVKLKALCAQHRIELFSVDDIEAELRAQRGTSSMTVKSADMQLELLAKARVECTSQGGCLAAASDILRTLTPTLQVRDPNTKMLTEHTRIYSDFDNTLSDKLPAQISLASDELLMPERINNCLFASNPEGKIMSQVRSNILNNYQEDNLKGVLLVVCHEAMMKSDRCLIDMNKLMASTFEPFQEKLNAIKDQEPNFSPYPINDLFSLRQALKDLMLYSSGKERSYWKQFYMQLTINMTGPAAYSTEIPSQLRACYHSDDLNLFDLEFECDNSWVPGFVPKISNNNPQAPEISKPKETIQCIKKFKDCKSSINDLKSIFSSNVDSIKDEVDEKINFNKDYFNK